MHNLFWLYVKIIIIMTFMFAVVHMEADQKDEILEAGVATLQVSSYSNNHWPGVSNSRGNIGS